MVVLVHGPRGVGKSTLIRALVKHYTHQSLGEVGIRIRVAEYHVETGFTLRLPCLWITLEGDCMLSCARASCCGGVEMLAVVAWLLSSMLRLLYDA